jgi:hypothetical protein
VSLAGSVPSPLSLEQLSDAELLDSTRRLVGRSNQLLAELLLHLGEVEERGIGDGLLRVDADGRAIELVRVDAVVKRWPREPEASATLVPLRSAPKRREVRPFVTSPHFFPAARS